MPILLLVGLLALVVGCDRPKSPVAYGASNSVIVAAPGPLWEEVKDTVSAALEPTILTVREERTFDLTHVAPDDPEWDKLRRWKQVLVIGEPDDPWMRQVLDRMNGVVDSLPAVVQTVDVWARGQRVIALVLPAGAGPAGVTAMVPQLRAFLDARFREWARERMFVSGVDTALQRQLDAEAGFSLVLPEVYAWDRRVSVSVFLNDHPRTRELGRSVLVTWRRGVGAVPPTEEVLAWRDDIAREYYVPVQAAGREPLEVEPVEVAGGSGIEVRGIWTSDDGGWPGAGPFRTRVLACPEQDRTYLVDAWLYAPAVEKYEYMVQLETILDSFECEGPARTPPAARGTGRVRMGQVDTVRVGR